MSEGKGLGPGPAPMEPLPAPPKMVIQPGPIPGSGTTATAAVAFTSVSSGAFVLWIFQCIAQKQIVQPSSELAMMMGAAILPLAHTVRNGLNAMLARWFRVEPTQL